MLKDCEVGKIDFVITKSLSRFARNTTDCLEMVRKLHKLGIPILFEKENLNTENMETELFLSVISSLAENESYSISENSKWGVRHRFESGGDKPSIAPFGYSLENGLFVINEDEAQWIRYIFNEFMKGKTSYAIADELNEMNVPTRNNKSWWPSTVIAILHNEKYKGDCLYQKTYTDFQLKRHKNNGEVDQFYEENHHEGIVSKELFDNANETLRKNLQTRNVETDTDKYHNHYAFTKKIICGECGANFKRRINSPGNQSYPAWVCKIHQVNKEKCSMKFIRESSLKNAFVTMMNKLTFGRKAILQNLLDALSSQSHKKRIYRVNDIERALGGIVERQNNLSTLATKGYLDPADYTAENNGLIADAQKLMQERDELTNEIKCELKSTEALRDIIKYVTNTSMLSEFDDDLFNRFVDRIVVNSQTEIEFNLKCGLKIRERI